MNILFLSNIFDYPFYGPSHCVPEIVRAQAEVDSVFWYNTVHREEDWNALPYYHDLLEYPSLSIHDLPEPYKEVFSLRVFAQLSFRDIGSLFGKNENWACVVFHRARTKLQNKEDVR